MGYVTSRIHQAWSQIASSQPRLWLTALLAVGASSVAFEAVLGQAEWPSRPINLLVPYSAGSASDTLARILIGPLHEKMGQPFIIENRVGADGMIAGRAVARAEPNGYTQYFGVTTSLSLAYNLQPNLGFDPRKDYAPVSMIGQTAYLLVVNSALGVNSIPELVALAKSKPRSAQLLVDRGRQHRASRHAGPCQKAWHPDDAYSVQIVRSIDRRRRKRSHSAATRNDIAHDPALPGGEGPYPGRRQ
jgi:tripartite-type tricarboxylate transporter receptor subunit TctC